MMKHKSRAYPQRLYTAGTAPFDSGPATLAAFAQNRLPSRASNPRIYAPCYAYSSEAEVKNHAFCILRSSMRFYRRITNLCIKRLFPGSKDARRPLLARPSAPWYKGTTESGLCSPRRP